MPPLRASGPRPSRRGLFRIQDKISSPDIRFLLLPAAAPGAAHVNEVPRQLNVGVPVADRYDLGHTGQVKFLFTKMP